MNDTSQGVAPRRERVAWCLFDFANSAFPTIALTAFGGPYFTGVLAKDGVAIAGFELGPSSAWGLALSISMLLVTLTAPVMGAIADRAGKKKLLGLYVALCIGSTVGLAFVPPGAGLAAFFLYIVANFAFEGAYVFYNAFLPELTTPDRVGRLSGHGWALGYAGGLLALVAVLPILPKQFTPEGAGAASMIFLVIAAWYAVFSIPTFLWLKDRARATEPQDSGDIRAAFRSVGDTLRNLRAYPAVLFFLAAFFLYNDGIVTVIEFTGVFTSHVLAFTPFETIVLFLVMNGIAAPGAIFFGSLLDRIGGKRTIQLSLLVWIAVVIGAMLVTTKIGFWPIAFLAAIVIGATQASSRALMARLAPRDRMGEFMGLLALSGKASAIFGPTIYGVTADLASSPADPSRGHRVAIGCIGVLFLASLFLLRRVTEPAVGMQPRELTGEQKAHGP